MFSNVVHCIFPLDRQNAWQVMPTKLDFRMLGNRQGQQWGYNGAGRQLVTIEARKEEEVVAVSGMSKKVEQHLPMCLLGTCSTCYNRCTLCLRVLLLN